MPKVAQNCNDDAPAERDAEALSKVASKRADAASEAVGSAGRMAPGAEERKAAREASEDTAELGTSMAALFAEQTRHSIEVATALGRARNWGEVAHAQNEFIAGSFERMSRWGDQYLAFVRTGMNAISSPWRH